MKGPQSYCTELALRLYLYRIKLGIGITACVRTLEIELLCVGKVSEDIVETSMHILSEALRFSVKLLGVVDAPSRAYNPLRDQYLADKLLIELTRYRSSLESIFFVLANVDAYVERLNFVFGIALPYTRAAAVFIPRLLYLARNREHVLSRIRKEVLHEVGHVLGLEHCYTPRCVMNFSNSVLEVDAKEAAFCTRCASKLKHAGIELDPRYILYQF